jgi:DNA-binding transcriptional MerR regulator
MASDHAPERVGSNGSKFAVKDGQSGAQAYEERLLAIHAMRAEGLTLREIGEAFGITRERVRQLLVMSNGPTVEQVREYRREQREAQVAETKHELVAWLRLHPGSTMQEAGRALNWTDEQLSQASSQEALRLSVQHKESASYQEFSEGDALAAIRQAWRLTSPTAEWLSHKRYGELLDSGAFEGPSGARITQRFGTWSRACDLARVPAGKTPRRVYESNWTDGEIIALVVQYLSTPGTTGTFGGWDAWRQEHAPHAPSGAMLRNRLGKWSEVKALALASAASQGLLASQ